jgi:hypothetical protein
MLELGRELGRNYCVGIESVVEGKLRWSPKFGQVVKVVFCS